MTIAIGNNLIAKPVLPIKGDPVKPSSVQQIAEPNELQALPLPVDLSSSLASLESVQVQGLAESATEGAFELSTPDEILEWTDDTPPIEAEFEEIELKTNKKVESIDSAQDGSEEEDKNNEEGSRTETESADGEAEEELVQEAA